MQVDATTQLRNIVTAQPTSSRVLQRHGLDFCCGGARTLDDACARLGLSADQVLQEIAATQDRGTSARWDEVPVDELIAHILEVYHQPLPEELEQLQAMADKVLRVHGDKDPERLAKLADTVRAMTRDLLPHMQKEEQILFPWILDARQPSPQGPIAVMEHEHEQVAILLADAKALTDDFTPPPGACNTWTNLYARLEAFDLDLREHIHLENNILFPMAVG